MHRMAPASPVVAQLRRGALEFCVLALLARHELYGFELVRTLGAVEGMGVSEGTVYPLLSRLKREGHVSTTWRDSTEGPPRKYYAITEHGREALRAFIHEWSRFRTAVDSLLPEGEVR